MSIVTTATWVPRGFAAPFPQKYNFDEEEFERIAELAKLQLEDAEDDLDEARGGGESSSTARPQDSAAKNESSSNRESREEWVYLPQLCL